MGGEKPRVPARYWASKLMIVGGLVLAGHGLLVASANHAEQAERDRLYRQTLDAVAARDDAQVIDRAAVFLRRVQPDRGEDLRFDQVATFLDRATLRRVVALNRAGDPKAAEGALDSYRRTVAQITR